ncbi:MAG: TlpA family protein disulfide reductase [Chloroflexota bacterium]|nr:TlpA family protein disulfide reductase [Chloroflexota bacterium]
MADSSDNDARDSESVPPFRVLPRGVQVGIGLLLAVAIVLGIVFFNRESGGVGITDPGATLPKVGDRLASFPLTDADGRPFDLASLAGRPIWINIWASWCPPCRTEMPDLEALYQKEKATYPDLVLLSLNTADSREAGLKFFRDLKLTSTLVFNDESRDLGPYRVQNFPSQILVGRDGKVKGVLQQATDEAQAREEIQIILK